MLLHCIIIQAIMNMDASPEEGFDKLQYLIGSQVFPPETFPNLIILYLKVTSTIKQTMLEDYKLLIDRN
jgi:hypothetical protein